MASNTKQQLKLVYELCNDVYEKRKIPKNVIQEMRKE